MYKVISLLKRKSGLTLAEFIDYYETKHARLGEKYLPTAKLYTRRYLHPLVHAVSGEETDEPEFDVVMELWFEDEDAYLAALAAMPPEAFAEIAEDEVHFMDSSRSRMFFAEEHTSSVGS
jgi:uncharacterized protein (TIGR02118 family)